MSVPLGMIFSLWGCSREGKQRLNQGICHLTWLLCSVCCSFEGKSKTLATLEALFQNIFHSLWNHSVWLVRLDSVLCVIYNRGTWKTTDTATDLTGFWNFNRKNAHTSFGISEKFVIKHVFGKNKKQTWRLTVSVSWLHLCVLWCTENKVDDLWLRRQYQHGLWFIHFAARAGGELEIKVLLCLKWG